MHNLETKLFILCVLKAYVHKPDNNNIFLIRTRRGEKLLALLRDFDAFKKTINSSHAHF